MTIGQTVYTVNAKTNSVDSWTYSGQLPSKDGLLIHLTRGDFQCVLPARCVYESKDKALAVAKIKN